MGNVDLSLSYYTIIRVVDTLKRNKEGEALREVLLNLKDHFCKEEFVDIIRNIVEDEYPIIYDEMFDI